MILVDTSVWIDHFRSTSRALVQLLTAGTVSMHPHIVGELACGHLARRHTTINLLQTLPKITAATDNEALTYLERHRLYGAGLGYIDLHLLASVAMDRGQLWTTDKRLQAQALRLRVAYRES